MQAAHRAAVHQSLPITKLRSGITIGCLSAWPGVAGTVCISIGTVAAEKTWTAVVAAGLVAFAVNYAGVLRGYFGAAGPALTLPLVIALVNAAMSVQQLAGVSETAVDQAAQAARKHAPGLLTKGASQCAPQGRGGMGMMMGSRGTF